MPLSAAEKQRRYRADQDADPQRRAKYLETERKKWKRDRELGKIKTINMVSEGEQRSKRWNWRIAQTKCRAMKKAASVALNCLTTPPETPEPDPQQTGSSMLGFGNYIALYQFTVHLTQSTLLYLCKISILPIIGVIEYTRSIKQ